MQRPKRPPFYCSFCGKAEHEVFVLIAGPMVFICDECVALAQHIITERRIKNTISPPVTLVEPKD